MGGVGGGTGCKVGGVGKVWGDKVGSFGVPPFGMGGGNVGGGECGGGFGDWGGGGFVFSPLRLSCCRGSPRPRPPALYQASEVPLSTAQWGRNPRSARRRGLGGHGGGQQWGRGTEGYPQNAPPPLLTPPNSTCRSPAPLTAQGWQEGPPGGGDGVPVGPSITQCPPPQ